MVQTATPFTGASTPENKHNTSKSSRISSIAFSPLVEKDLLARRESKDERAANLQIRDLVVKRDTLIKAIKYTTRGESAKIVALTEKWRDVAQQASAYLLNDLKIKVDRMGGKSQWQKATSKSGYSQTQTLEMDQLEKLQEYVESPEFEDLGSYEQKNVLKRLEELEKVCAGQEEQESSGHIDSDTDGGLTMRDLYAYLKLDHGVVFE